MPHNPQSRPEFVVLPTPLQEICRIPWFIYVNKEVLEHGYLMKTRKGSPTCRGWFMHISKYINVKCCYHFLLWGGGGCLFVIVSCQFFQSPLFMCKKFWSPLCLCKINSTPCKRTPPYINNGLRYTKQSLNFLFDILIFLNFHCNSTTILTSESARIVVLLQWILRKIKISNKKFKLCFVYLMAENMWF